MDRDESPSRVLVTGAGSPSGIGWATVASLARGGHRVVANDVEEGPLIELRDTLRAEGVRHDVEVLVADVSEAERFEERIRELTAVEGLTGLVANAGIANRRILGELRRDAWLRVMDVNFGGVLHAVRGAESALRASGGAVVAVSSIMGPRWGWSGHGHYAASKGAIEGLVRSLAIELGGDGVRVNAVAPGFITTAQSTAPDQAGSAERLARIEPFVPLGRVGRADDVARVIEFLLGEGARYVTGQAIVVDGGLTLGNMRPAFV
ncbi:MAG TPA: SDR family NAD(P)-dependent oxidoreductase [Myxococcales bacterium LLY-WYZ-16_1]|nr:SDR family NAD(P)-dependent oxidoreductase [Myxococcales bacterium LLY-WYZ-16_1]